MIRTGSGRKLAGAGEPGQLAKNLQRLLAKAEQRIRNLQEQVADQKEQIRELQAQAKREGNLAVEREEQKAEIADLKSEIRELTRANREQVEKIEALRAASKLERPGGLAAAAHQRGQLQPSLR